MDRISKGDAQLDPSAIIFQGTLVNKDLLWNAERLRVSDCVTEAILENQQKKNPPSNTYNGENFDDYIDSLLQNVESHQKRSRKIVYRVTPQKKPKAPNIIPEFPVYPPKPRVTVINNSKVPRVAKIADSYRPNKIQLNDISIPENAPNYGENGLPLSDTSFRPNVTKIAAPLASALPNFLSERHLRLLSRESARSFNGTSASFEPLAQPSSYVTTSRNNKNRLQTNENSRYENDVCECTDPDVNVTEELKTFENTTNERLKAIFDPFYSDELHKHKKLKNNKNLPELAKDVYSSSMNLQMRSPSKNIFNCNSNSEIPSLMERRNQIVMSNAADVQSVVDAAIDNKDLPSIRVHAWAAGGAESDEICHENRLGTFKNPLRSVEGPLQHSIQQKSERVRQQEQDKRIKSRKMLFVFKKKIKQTKPELASAEIFLRNEEETKKAEHNSKNNKNKNSFVDYCTIRIIRRAHLRRQRLRAMKLLTSPSQPQSTNKLLTSSFSKGQAKWTSKKKSSTVEKTTLPLPRRDGKTDWNVAADGSNCHAKSTSPKHSYQISLHEEKNLASPLRNVDYHIYSPTRKHVKDSDFTPSSDTTADNNFVLYPINNSNLPYLLGDTSPPAHHARVDGRTSFSDDSSVYSSNSLQKHSINNFNSTSATNALSTKSYQRPAPPLSTPILNNKNPNSSSPYFSSDIAHRTNKVLKHAAAQLEAVGGTLRPEPPLNGSFSRYDFIDRIVVDDHPYSTGIYEAVNNPNATTIHYLNLTPLPLVESQTDVVGEGHYSSPIRKVSAAQTLRASFSKNSTTSPNLSGEYNNNGVLIEKDGQNISSGFSHSPIRNRNSLTQLHAESVADELKGGRESSELNRRLSTSSAHLKSEHYKSHGQHLNYGGSKSFNHLKKKQSDRIIFRGRKGISNHLPYNTQNLDDYAKTTITKPYSPLRPTTSPSVETTSYFNSLHEPERNEKSTAECDDEVKNALISLNNQKRNLTARQFQMNGASVDGLVSQGVLKCRRNVDLFTRTLSQKQSVNSNQSNPFSVEGKKKTSKVNILNVSAKKKFLEYHMPMMKSAIPLGRHSHSLLDQKLKIPLPEPPKVLRKNLRVHLESSFKRKNVIPHNNSFDYSHKDLTHSVYQGNKLSKGINNIQHANNFSLSSQPTSDTSKMLFSSHLKTNSQCFRGRIHPTIQAGEDTYCVARIPSSILPQRFRPPSPVCGRSPHTNRPITCPANPSSLSLEFDKEERIKFVDNHSRRKTSPHANFYLDLAVKTMDNEDKQKLFFPSGRRLQQVNSVTNGAKHASGVHGIDILNIDQSVVGPGFVSHFDNDQNIVSVDDEHPQHQFLPCSQKRKSIEHSSKTNALTPMRGCKSVYVPFFGEEEMEDNSSLLDINKRSCTMKDTNDNNSNGVLDGLNMKQMSFAGNFISDSDAKHMSLTAAKSTVNLINRKITFNNISPFPNPRAPPDLFHNETKKGILRLFNALSSPDEFAADVSAVRPSSEVLADSVYRIVSKGLPSSSPTGLEFNATTSSNPNTIDKRRLNSITLKKSQKLNGAQFKGDFKHDFAAESENENKIGCDLLDQAIVKEVLKRSYLRRKGMDTTQNNDWTPNDEEGDVLAALNHTYNEDFHQYQDFEEEEEEEEIEVNRDESWLGNNDNY